ncbi:unnamed protein product [Bursaphelenchus xylophilus]|uniref:(pine wood nematode) hypothetical protein n=1 Tax=Bursaphelenchus xylophilus TaxID=6326 RepID=A0A1I7SFT0_BURXY|nr:unnamed protein product [Bursaphelenchus xylophilus]CAG9113060.1 unnamed protein product [Bursaphelenchus xylophilus]
MGKRKHIKSGAGDLIKAPGGLADQIEVNTFAQSRGKPRGILKKTKQDGEFVPDVLSSKILREASKQLAAEEPQNVTKVEPKVLMAKDVFSQLRTSSKRKDSEDSSEEEDVLDDDEFPALASSAPQDLPEFLHGEDKAASDFATSVLHSVNFKKQQFEKNFSTQGADPTAGLSENVVKMYQEIGQYMHYYRSGKIPKAFKSIPALKNWEQILEITQPDKYTAAAMLHATRLFAAVASPKACERFYRYYLLPRVLDDIMEYRKLNVHLYTAVKKSIYKPTSFVKGLLLPICEPDMVSMNVAHVVKAVIQSTSLPVFHAATAIIKLAQQRPTSSPVSYILTGFIQKRYTLPSLCIDSLLDYFCSYEDKDERMPLSLHSAIHEFVKTYKLELDTQQKQRLLNALNEYGNKMARKDTINLLNEVMPEDVEMEDA